MMLDNAQLGSAVIGMIVPLSRIRGVATLRVGAQTHWCTAGCFGSGHFPGAAPICHVAGQWDQVFPLFLLTGLYFIQTGLESRSAWRFVVAGVVFSCATFLNLGNISWW